tara:strand:- start:211 stop:1095 length:885 start_codon:yes stop_codon:yes gene_type:complete
MPKKKKSKSQKGKKKGTSSFTKKLMAGILSVSENYIKLQKLIALRAGKNAYVDKTLKTINQKTVRMVSDNLKTKAGQFTFTNGMSVKKGINYHIHYTKNLEEYYMTQQAHNNITSKLIFPVKRTSTFSIYNGLNKQSPMILKSDVRPPTDKNYAAGSITRYFAKKANEVMSKPFEINAKQMSKSPLYIYTSFPWLIKGERDLVGVLNSRSIRVAEKVMPNIGKYLNPFQLYRKSKALDNAEAILEKLGVVDYSEMERTQVAGGSMGAGLSAMMKKSSGKKKKKKSGKTKSKKKY